MKRPSPALVIACAALLVSMSGVGYAAVKLPRNSVGATQLKNNAVNSKKVKDRSLRAVDFGLGQLPKGDKGDPGEDGAAGPGATKIDATVANGAQQDVALPGGYTLRLVCSGDASHRLFTLGVPGGSGGAQLTAVKSISDLAANTTAFTAGAGVPSGQFVGIGVGQPNPNNTSGFFYRMGGTMVLHDGTGVTTVVFDAFLENRSNQGTCLLRGTAVPST